MLPLISNNKSALIRAKGRESIDAFREKQAEKLGDNPSFSETLKAFVLNADTSPPPSVPE